MTDEEFNRAMPVIEMAIRLHGELHAQLCKRGVHPIDALIASLYSTHAFGTRLHGNQGLAVEWMRDGVDTIERQLLEAKG